MGLLSADQERKCYLHLGYLGVNRTGVFVGGMPQTTQVTHKLQASLDNILSSKLATITDLIAKCDTLYDNLFAVDASFQAKKAGKIELQDREFEMRVGQYDYFRRMLGVQLDVAVDPMTEADNGDGSAGGAQGPWREP